MMPAKSKQGVPEKSSFDSPLRDDVRQQFALRLGDHVFEQQFALFQALHLKLIERRPLRNLADDVVQISMLGSHFFQSAKRRQFITRHFGLAGAAVCSTVDRSATVGHAALVAIAPNRRRLRHVRS